MRRIESERYNHLSEVRCPALPGGDADGSSTWKGSHTYPGDGRWRGGERLGEVERTTRGGSSENIDEEWAGSKIDYSRGSEGELEIGENDSDVVRSECRETGPLFDESHDRRPSM